MIMNYKSWRIPRQAVTFLAQASDPKSPNYQLTNNYLHLRSRMHYLSLILAFVVTTATAAELKVNYYSDGECTAYILSLHPGVSFGCYDYNWQGSNSANIADCTYPNGVCACTFYTQAGCKGASQSVDYPNNNCASNYGHGFLSMKCGIIHDPKMLARDPQEAGEAKAIEAKAFTA